MLDAASDVLVLHHRPPGRRATIAHLVVGPAGVYVVEVQDGAPLSVAVRRAAKHEQGPLRTMICWSADTPTTTC